jgi:hypothetical protein
MFTVIHVGLAVSILLLLFAGARLQISLQLFSLFFFTVAIILAIYFLRKLSTFYILSSILQEACLLLASVLLISEVEIILVALFTSLVYSLGHLMSKEHWQIKLLVTASWGIGSILLYYHFEEPLLNFAIHIIGGAALIKQGLLYPKNQDKRAFLLR